MTISKSMNQDMKSLGQGTLEILQLYKLASAKCRQESKLSVEQNGGVVAFLSPIADHLGNDEKKYVQFLSDWRQNNLQAYPTVFKVTIDGTKKWIRSQLIDRADRILFMLLGLDGHPIGHMGISNYDPYKKEAEADNIVRGVKGDTPGIMTCALMTLCQWAFERLQLKRLYLRVFSENENAIRLYERCGFHKVKEIPLHKVMDGEVIRFEEITDGQDLSADRKFLLMELFSSAEG